MKKNMLNGVQEKNKMGKNIYIERVLGTVKRRNAGEPEFLQAVTEVLESLGPVIEQKEI